MARRDGPLSSLLVAALVVMVAAESGDEMTVYQDTTLPSSAAIMNMTSSSVCGCRVRCLSVDFCTAVTAHTGSEGVTCIMTNETQPENIFLSHESAVSFAKGSQAGDESGGDDEQTAEATGTYFVSSGRSYDGTHTKYFCEQQGGSPASISDAQSLADLKASDEQDGTTDINTDGIWVFVKTDDNGNKLFFDNEPISSSSSGVTLDTTAAGECMRLRVDDVLASAECIGLTRVAFACFKEGT